MKINQKTKQIIIAVGVIVFVFIGFKMFFTSPDDATLAADKAKETFIDGQATLALLKKLKGVSLDEAIFSSPVFNSLVNFEVSIPDQIHGRPNPFAPIGVDVSAVAINSTSTTRTR